MIASLWKNSHLEAPVKNRFAYPGICIGVALVLLAGCAPGVSSQVQEVPNLPAYDGPRASIVLGSFDCSAANCFQGIGEGMADAMVTALVQSSRFQVVEASGNLGTLEDELNVTGEAGAFEGADLALVGSVTQFEPNAGGTESRGGVLNLFGGGSANRATAAIDLRVVDVRTRTIVAVARVTGEATSVGLSGGARAFGLGSGALSTYENTPMETAIQDMIYTAVIELGNKIPQEYYRY